LSSPGDCLGTPNLLADFNAKPARPDSTAKAT
jgi:hypothetical protein